MVPVDDDYIYDEFPVPKPENYEQMKEEMRLNREAIQLQTDALLERNAPSRNLLRRLNSFFRKGSPEGSGIEWNNPHQPGIV